MTTTIRVRACLAVVQDERLLLVPHYQTDAGAVQWNIPGGGVEFGEALELAARREFTEETGLQAQITGILTITEVIQPQKPWHSITITFAGALTDRVSDGQLLPEIHPTYGQKVPQWFTAEAVRQVAYHPKPAVEKALKLDRP